MDILRVQWLTFKLSGITYLGGKIKFKLLFHGPKWLSKIDNSLANKINNILVTDISCNNSYPGQAPRNPTIFYQTRENSCVHEIN